MRELLDIGESFASEIRHAATPEAVETIVTQHIEKLGFDRFTYVLLRPPAGPLIPYFITSYPEGWSARYLEKDYKNIDPVLLSVPQSLTPYRWDSFRRIRSIRSHQIAVLDEARDFKLNSGLTVPIHGPRQALAQFSVGTEKEDQAFEELWKHERFVVMGIAQYLHEAIINRIHRSDDHSFAKLAPRERECLLWSARGKSAWEISQIIVTSEETVVGYFKRAQDKFGVSRRTHAVVKAILGGHIIP